MLYLLSQFSEFWSPLRVFKYISFRSMMAAGTALVFCLLIGPWIIRKLTELKIGQPIRTAEEVHRLAELHRQKKGIPTMGGVLIISAVLVSSLLWARLDSMFVGLSVGSMVLLGAI